MPLNGNHLTPGPEFELVLYISEIYQKCTYRFSLYRTMEGRSIARDSVYPPVDLTSRDGGSILRMKRFSNRDFSPSQEISLE